jgi:hypothetical protein
MFVRWKRRERKTRKAYEWERYGRAKGTGKYLLIAVLVRSERQDGKPRQKIVGYLGSVPEGLADEPFQRKWFWDRARHRLDALALEQTERQKVEGALAARVPRLTVEELDVLKKKQEEARAFVVQAVIKCGGDLSALAKLLA